MIALVGQSGSGKSTLISLLQRFYSPTIGQILLDGIDIKNLNIHWLRSKCSYVEQEPVLFNISIKENICYGIEGDVSQEQIDEAARKANIYDRIQSLRNVCINKLSTIDTYIINLLRIIIHNVAVKKLNCYPLGRNNE